MIVLMAQYFKVTALRWSFVATAIACGVLAPIANRYHRELPAAAALRAAGCGISYKLPLWLEWLGLRRAASEIGAEEILGHVVAVDCYCHQFEELVPDIVQLQGLGQLQLWDLRGDAGDYVVSKHLIKKEDLVDEEVAHLLRLDVRPVRAALPRCCISLCGVEIRSSASR